MNMKCSVAFMLFVTLLVTANTIADQCVGLVCIPENYSKIVLPFQNQTNNIKIAIRNRLVIFIGIISFNGLRKLNLFKF